MESANPNPTESHGSSPVKASAPAPTSGAKSAVGQYFRMKTEKPTEPPTADRAFAQVEVADTSVGNPHYTAELIDEGKLGLFLPRDRARRTPIPVTINPGQYREGIFQTILSVLKRLLRNKTEMGHEDITARVTDVANSLADGCCLMTFMKLRALLYLEFPNRYNPISLRRPKALKDLAIPTPYAFAIQQLGAVNAADLPSEHRYVPVYPEIGHRFGIPNSRVWHDNAYASAVEYARNLGMQFSIVDLNKKSGTAWWLLRPYYAEETFELQCTLPEVNFTDSMALTFTLFLLGNNANPTNAIFTLPEGLGNYGYILRDPHTGINVTTYEAIEDKSAEVVAMV